MPEFDALRTRIEAIETSAASNTSAITALQTTDADHETRISALEATAADHETRIVALEAGDPTPPPPPPPPSGKPTAANTGPTGTLTPQAANVYLTTAGTIIENLDITGAVFVQAPNCIIRNCRITGYGGFYGIKANEGAHPITLEDCEVTNFDNCVVGGHVTMRRCHLHGTSYDGHTAASESLYEDCFFERFGTGAGAHADGIQCSGGSNITLTRCNIDMPVGLAGHLSNSCVTLVSTGTIDSILIEDCWLNGGNYTIYCHSQSGGPDPTNVTVRGCRFGRDYSFGLLSGAVTTWENNTWEDDGTPAP